MSDPDEVQRNRQALVRATEEVCTLLARAMAAPEPPDSHYNDLATKALHALLNAGWHLSKDSAP